MNWDVAVIGGGHAGIEAAAAASRLGARTLLVVPTQAAIGRMSCNPAIGGVAKGQLVRDIDALGGRMGRLADAAGIQFRMLNRSKGPAVWGPRAQMDMEEYSRLARRELRHTPGLEILEGALLRLEAMAGGGYRLGIAGSSLVSRAVVITTGTFLGAIMYTGLTATAGGRIGEAPSLELAASIRSLGLVTRRLKTGTPARIHKSSIDFSACVEQPGDPSPMPFSLHTRHTLRNRAVCWITRTNEKTHTVLREGFDRSPIFTGTIRGVGPRYCPSIEDKIQRFSQRDSHQLFLEPEGLFNDRVYVNGFSSSLPWEIQDRALRTIPGLAQCRVLRYGYAVEYDAVDATQLHHTLECKDLPGLYFAGQVNGTSGYEEAAAQGLVAGVNAARRVLDKEHFLLSRAESYIGVLVDDLVTTELEEPYRMFTSRAEFRLHLRQDNAEDRLCETGRRIGLLAQDEFDRFDRERTSREELARRLEGTRVTPGEFRRFVQGGFDAHPQPLREPTNWARLLRRPGLQLESVLAWLGWATSLNPLSLASLVAEWIYQGYYHRQERDIERSKRLMHLTIPGDFDYDSAVSMRLEARQKLTREKPLTVGAAAKLDGVSPADVSGLLYHLKKHAQIRVEGENFAQTEPVVSPQAN